MMEKLMPLPVENRFPLDLSVAVPEIDRLYEQSKLDVWAPAEDADWAGARLVELTDEQREAGRRVWSRRAWLEYTGIAETPALLLRFCLERGRERDAKYFLTVKNTEEAELVDAFYRYAEALGGYLERPDNAAWEGVIDRGCANDALDAEVPLDGYFAANCALEDGLELELFRAYLANAREPLARTLLGRAVADKSRHAAFAWSYLDARAPSLSVAARREARQALVDWLEKVAFAGYHLPSLALTIDSGAEQRAMAQAAAAGLGAVGAREEEAVFRDYLARARERLAGLGLELPVAKHPRLGAL